MQVVYQSSPNNPDGWEDDFFQSALDEVVPQGAATKRAQAAEEYRALINELKDDAKRRPDEPPRIGPAKQDAVELANKSEALASDFRVKASAFEAGAATFNPRDANPTDQETEDFIALATRYAHQLDEIAATLRQRAGRYPPNVDAMTLYDIRFGTEAQAMATKAKYFFRRYNPEKTTKIKAGPFHTFVWITYQLVYGPLPGKAGEEPTGRKSLQHFVSALLRH